LSNFHDLWFLLHHPIGVLLLVYAFFMFELINLLNCCFPVLKQISPITRLTHHGMWAAGWSESDLCVIRLGLCCCAHTPSHWLWACSKQPLSKPAKPWDPARQGLLWSAFGSVSVAE
jgi:hypothetical protein